jgi:hypothetical protein
MKTVFNNRQLAHVWAQQNQPNGRGSNFFFDGPSIFSFGRHFEIARFVTRKGQRAVLFTSRGYSVTTSKHKHMARSALHGLTVPVFYVADIYAAARKDKTTREAFKACIQTAVETAAKARSASRAESEHQRAQALAHEANAYAEFFGLRWRLPVPELTPERVAELRAACKAESAKQRAAKAKAKAKADARREQEYQEALREWREFKRDSVPLSHHYPTALRYHVATDTIQTSRGAEVPATVAAIVWPMVEETRRKGDGFEFTDYANRPRLGSFTLDSIDAQGNVTAGCHVLPYSELRALAVRFGFAVTA